MVTNMEPYRHELTFIEQKAFNCISWKVTSMLDSLQIKSDLNYLFS